MGEGDLQPQEEERGKEVAGVMGGGAQHKDDVEDEEEEDEDAPFKPFVLPGEWRKKDEQTGIYRTDRLGFTKNTNVAFVAGTLFFGVYLHNLRS